MRLPLNCRPCILQSRRLHIRLLIWFRCSAPGSIMAEPFPLKSFEEFPFSMMTWMVLSLEELLVSSPEKNPSRSEDELSESGDWLSEPEELSEPGSRLSVELKLWSLKSSPLELLTELSLSKEFSISSENVPFSSGDRCCGGTGRKR